MLTPSPYLLLDVDGVLNPLGLQPPDLIPEGFVAHRLAGLRVLLAPVHGVWLRELSAVFDLVWATSWEQDANRLIAPLLGLPKFLPVITFGADQTGWTVKLPAVAAFAADRAVAWVDDRFGDDEEAWASARPAPTLLVRTDHSVGITRAVVDQLWTFGMELGSSRVRTRSLALLPPKSALSALADAVYAHTREEREQPATPPESRTEWRPLTKPTGAAALVAAGVHLHGPGRCDYGAAGRCIYPGMLRLQFSDDAPPAGRPRVLWKGAAVAAVVAAGIHVHGPEGCDFKDGDDQCMQPGLPQSTFSDWDR